MANATLHSLEDDAQTLSWLFRSLRSSKIARQLGRTEAKAGAALVWWKTCSSKPKVVPLFRQLVDQGGALPVFGGLSLCIPGLAPSLRVLVPYLRARRGLEGFVESVWLSGTEGQKCPNTRWEPLARELSHAIANLAYSVRLRDRPLRGWLAYAHKLCHPLYIPDVRCAPQHGPATTAAVEEEPFLGMASVLYLPIAGPDLPPLRGLGAQAVLILWSPIPGHWDHLDARLLQRGVCQVIVPHLLPDALAPHVPWLHLLLLKENEKYTEMGTQLVGLLCGLERWAGKSLDSELAARFHEEFAHGATSFVLAYTRPRGGVSPRLQSWLNEQLTSATGPIGIVDREWSRSFHHPSQHLNDAALSLFWRGKKSSANRSEFIGTLRDTDSVLSLIPKSLALSVRADVASDALRDAAANLASDAEALYAVELEISHRYCGISFRFEPKKSARRRLYGTRKGFERYFATRRGLVVPPAGPESYGIGLALHTRLAAGLGVYRRLYVSPDGKIWRVDLALPVKQRRSAAKSSGVRK